MHDVKVPHGTVLIGARTFNLASSENGLVAAKLAKIRKALAEEQKTSADGFDAVAKGFAKLDEKGEPIQKMVTPEKAKPAEGQKPEDVKDPEPQPQFFGFSGTKKYELADGKTEEELTKALEEYNKGLTELTVPELTEADMQWIVCAPNGQKMAIPEIVSDVLHYFAPAM